MVAQKGESRAAGDLMNQAAVISIFVFTLVFENVLRLVQCVQRDCTLGISTHTTPQSAFVIVGLKYSYKWIQTDRTTSTCPGNHHRDDDDDDNETF
jgi:hypothetical protein